MHDRKRTFGTLLGLCATTIMLSGCGILGSEAQGPLSGGGPDSNDSDRSDTGTGCTAYDYSVTIDLKPPRHDFGVLELTNTSSQVCDVEGWTGLTVRSDSELPEQVPFKQVEQPGPAVPLKLEPGQSAYSGVRFVPGQEGGDDSYAVREVVAIPPDTNNSIPAKLTSAGSDSSPHVTISAIEMGTLQPDEEAVATW